VWVSNLLFNLSSTGWYTRRGSGIKIYKSHNKIPLKTKLGNAEYMVALTAYLSVSGSSHFLYCLIPHVLRWNNVNGHEMSCRPLSPGGGKPISISSVAQLSLHLSRYLLAKCCFHWQIITWSVIINSGPSPIKSACRPVILKRRTAAQCCAEIGG
jgi:hypothetical protein